MSYTDDEDFIRRTVDTYSDMVLRIAFQYVRNKADAEDILQEVFIRLLKRHAFDNETHLKAWLIRVTINKSKDHLRAKKVRQAACLDGLSFGFESRDNHIMQEIFDLAPTDRDIVYLFYYEGYSAKEIAGILGKRENTIHVRLVRARNKLKYLLEEELK